MYFFSYALAILFNERMKIKGGGIKEKE